MCRGVGVSLTLCKSPGKAIEHRDRSPRDPTDWFAADDVLLECASGQMCQCGGQMEPVSLEGRCLEGKG
jgi:hypothetical protein